MRIITVAWEDGLSAKAFSSWYLKNFFGAEKPPVLMLSSLNSEDVLLQKYQEAREYATNVLVVTIMLKKTHPDTRIPEFLMNDSEFVVRTNRDMEAKVVKEVSGIELLLNKWNTHVTTLAGA